MDDKQIEKEIPVFERRTSDRENNRNKNSKIEMKEDCTDGSNSSENNVDSELESDEAELDSDEAKVPADSEKEDFVEGET